MIWSKYNPYSWLKKITKKKIFIVLLCLLFLVVAVWGAKSAITYISHNRTEINSLKAKQEETTSQLNGAKSDLKNLNEQLTKNKKSDDSSFESVQTNITSLEEKVKKLETSQANHSVAIKYHSPTSGSVTNAGLTSSVYDRISSDNAVAKQKIVDAIQLIQAKTPSYFQIIQDQVEQIYVVNSTNLGCGGGVQIKRIIYIGYEEGSCLTLTSTADYASVTIHEAYHVYNVYVNRVLVMGKAQELPSLYAQRATYDALGVSQLYREFTESQIANYESM